MNRLVFLALSYAAIDVTAIMTTIANWIGGIIMAIGVLFGGYELFQGFTDDQPSKRKHGITVLIIGISIGGLIMVVFNMVIGGGGGGN